MALVLAGARRLGLAIVIGDILLAMDCRDSFLSIREVGLV